MMDADDAADDDDADTDDDDVDDDDDDDTDEDNDDDDDSIHVKMYKSDGFCLSGPSTKFNILGGRVKSLKTNATVLFDSAQLQ